MKKCAIPNIRIVAGCICLLLVAYIGSYIVTTAFATEVYHVESAEYNFTVGGKNYANLADLTMTEDGYSFPGVTVRSKYEMAPAGYLGARPCLYKEAAPGSNTYYLITAGTWGYNDGPCHSLGNLADREENLPAGYYMCCGETAVYYNGTYVRQWSYPTPFIQIR